MTTNTVVRPSLLHGKGLFAVRDFRRGQVVETVDGEIVLRESNSRFAVAMSGRRSLILTNKAKWINHGTGDDANVVINLKRGVVATKDIKAGDELLARYQGIFG